MEEGPSPVFYPELTYGYRAGDGHSSLAVCPRVFREGLGNDCLVWSRVLAILSKGLGWVPRLMIIRSWTADTLLETKLVRVLKTHGSGRNSKRKEAIGPRRGNSQGFHDHRLGPKLHSCSTWSWTNRIFIESRFSDQMSAAGGGSVGWYG